MELLEAAVSLSRGISLLGQDESCLLSLSEEAGPPLAWLPMDLLPPAEFPELGTPCGNLELLGGILSGPLMNPYLTGLSVR